MLRLEQVSSSVAPHGYCFETGSVMKPEAVLAELVGQQVSSICLSTSQCRGYSCECLLFTWMLLGILVQVRRSLQSKQSYSLRHLLGLV